MKVQNFLLAADHISTWAGKAVAWLIMVLMSVVCIEVFKRYILNAPTAWIFDFDNMLYGTLFMMCGAYTLAQDAHVSLGRLSRELGFRVADGLHDRVIFRELFPIGLTALDPIEEGAINGSLTASQISARREIEQLLVALALPTRAPGVEHMESRRLWRDRVLGYYHELARDAETAH